LWLEVSSLLEARKLLSTKTGVREDNRRKMIIEIMVKADIQSRIAKRSGLSPASVSTGVQELIKDSVIDAGRDSARRKGHVRLRAMRGVALGIDLGFRHLAVIGRGVDRPFTEICVQRRDEGANLGLATVLDSIRQMVGEVVDEIGQELTDVVSAGIAVPRMIDPRTGRFTTPVLPPWSADDEPAKELGRMLAVRVAIDNDANLGAMAEQVYGMEEPVETVVYVKASTGIGAGIVIGDTLLRGDRGMAGEIGHLTIDPGGDVCLCGGRGCLDTIIGAEALVAQARQARRRSPLEPPPSLSSVIEQALAGDAACGRILEDAGRTLGLALAQLCNLINPRLVVLGGELSVGKTLVLEPCGQELRRFALTGAVSGSDGFQLRASGLGGLAEAQGALILGLRSRKLELVE
jgi:predicted NBD/HSP70 family sugar kinase